MGELRWTIVGYANQEHVCRSLMVVAGYPSKEVYLNYHQNGLFSLPLPCLSVSQQPIEERRAKTRSLLPETDLARQPKRTNTLNATLQNEDSTGQTRLRPLY